MKHPVKIKVTAVGITPRKDPAGVTSEAKLARDLGVGWSFGWGAVVLSVVVNPVLGRSIHWDWMASLAPIVFVFLYNLYSTALGLMG